LRRSRLRAGGAALALASAAAAPVACSAALAPATVHVPGSPAVARPVSISFIPRATLPAGGYYYAVVVLSRYAGYSSASPPPCAVSSDMTRTVYGFAHARRRVRLTLLPARSAQRSWCAGGIYEGAVYAVPHRLRCTRAYPCSRASAQYGACWEVEGHPVCGVVVKPPEPTPPPPEPPKPPPPPGPPGPPPPAAPYSYPGGLPKPIDRSTHVIAHFKLRFAPALQAG
jgi:hypothetical protein